MAGIVGIHKLLLFTEACRTGLLACLTTLCLENGERMFSVPFFSNMCYNIYYYVAECLILRLLAEYYIVVMY